MEKSLNILFIGNSYTYYNDMPGFYFKKVAEESGDNVNVTAVTHGGAYLYQYADQEHELGRKLRNRTVQEQYNKTFIDFL